MFHDCHKAVNKHPFALIVANYIRPYTCVFHDKEPPSSVNGSPAIFGTTRLPIVHSQRRQDVVELSIRAIQLNLNARMYSTTDLCQSCTTSTTSIAEAPTTTSATTTATSGKSVFESLLYVPYRSAKQLAKMNFFKTLLGTIVERTNHWCDLVKEKLAKRQAPHWRKTLKSWQTLLNVIPGVYKTHGVTCAMHLLRRDVRLVREDLL